MPSRLQFRQYTPLQLDSSCQRPFFLTRLSLDWLSSQPIGLLQKKKIMNFVFLWNNQILTGWECQMDWITTTWIETPNIVRWTGTKWTNCPDVLALFSTSFNPSGDVYELVLLSLVSLYRLNSLLSMQNAKEKWEKRFPFFSERSKKRLQLLSAVLFWLWLYLNHKSNTILMSMRLENLFQKFIRSSQR